MGGPFARPVRCTANTVVAANGARLAGVTVGHADAGQTLKIYDDTTTSSPANQRFTIPLDTPQAWHFVVSARFENGIVAMLSGGSPDVTLLVE